jgi:hypothetical protein
MDPPDTQSMHLRVNTKLRDHLATLVEKGHASERDLNLIPSLAGALSETEERAIRQLIDELHIKRLPRELKVYLRDAAKTRDAFFDRLNALGRTNFFSTMGCIIGSWVVGVAEMFVDPENWEAGLLGAAFGATVAVFIGYSNACRIASKGHSYGVYD